MGQPVILVTLLGRWQKKDKKKDLIAQRNKTK